MAGQERTISVLKLFTLETPDRTVEDVANALGVSVSSAYRYVAALSEAGFLTTMSSGRYVLGPAVIQLDRQIQLTDPLLVAARPIMDELARFAPADSAVLLCRLFRDTVLCVHRVLAASTGEQVSYERGRPMPLFRGATSKVIMASLGPRDLLRFYKSHQAEIAAVGLGESSPTFRANMTKIRKAGHLVTHAEIDPGLIGIAAPILDDANRAMASLSYVISDKEAGSTARLAALVMASAREIEQSLRDGGRRA